MVARHDAAQASLMAQLKARRVKKTYLALVLGSVGAAVGRIEAPIGRDPRHRTRMAVVTDGRPSMTGYRVRERFPGWTLLELDLVTGRTHQIRVHLEAIGHPVAGDPVYGTGTSRPRTRRPRRLFLHAWRLELTSPIRRASHPGGGAAARRAGAGPRRAARGPDGDRRPTSAPIRPPLDRRRADRGRRRRRARRDAGDHLGAVGVGKDTIIDALRRAAPRPGLPLRRDLHDPRAATGRGGRRRLPLRRPRASSSRIRDAGGFLEANEVHGNWYGSPRDQVRAALADGPRRHPEDRRPGRPGRQGAGHRGAPDLRRPAVDGGRCSSGCGPGRRRPPTSSSCASATPPSSSRARSDYDHVVDQRDRPGRADRASGSTRSSPRSTAATRPPRPGLRPGAATA